MKKTKTLVALMLAVMFVLTIGLAACNQHVCGHVCPECGKCLDATCTDPACAQKCSGHGNNDDPNKPAEDLLPFAKGTVLRMATGYNDEHTGITFSAKYAGEGVTLANGQTYKSGDLKPTWAELQNRLGMKFESVYTGKKAAEEFGHWKEKIDQVDVISGTATLLNDNGPEMLINIADYLDKMPNFKAYLEANPIVRLSITGATEGANKGAIYFSPYFDGVNDIERMPLMRADWVRELLDGETAYNGANRDVNTSAYTPYITESYSIESLTADGQGTQTITKTFGTGATQNIIAQMNAKSGLKGNEAVAMLRAYIKAMYGNTYANPSDLYLGYDAAYDADELVALLRCVVASKSYGDNNAVIGLFSRETSKLQRQVDLFRFAGTLFGVRGLESRQDYLYFDKDGNLHDARQEEDTYKAIEKMNQMKQEGLILVKGAADDKTETFLENDSAFMHYDYSQTQTLHNETLLDEGEEYTPVMVPVAHWYDGSKAEGVYMRFTESWRSVKTDGWGLSKAGIGDNQDKLYAALKLIDYAYSKEGQILMSYGPDEFIKKDADGKMVMFDFNGEQWPVIADETYAELWDKAGGNYTNYARRYLGSTLSFVKSQSFEYQCTHEVGRKGAGKISAAIAKGTIKHPQLAVDLENKWYMSVPTTLPKSAEDKKLIDGLTNLPANFNQSSGTNILIDMIDKGYNINKDGITNAATAASTAKSWAKGYLGVLQDSWENLVKFYNSLSK